MSEEQSSTRIEFREIAASPYYRVSKTGVLQSSTRTKGKRWVTLKLYNKYAATPEKRPYLKGNIYINGKLKNVTIHRLVLETFVGPCPPGLEACHNNGNSLDNRVENLRYDTRKNNHADKKKHGTHIQGSQVIGSVLDEAKVERIITMLLEGRSGREIRAVFPISPQLLSKIAHKTHWKHVLPDRPVMSVPKPRGYHFKRDSHGFKIGDRSPWTQAPARASTPSTGER
jgi:hypothetical protein